MSEFLIRRFEPNDAVQVSALIAETMRVSNSKDYSTEILEKTIARLTPECVSERASWMHFYVVCDCARIIGCGAIGSYWGKADESCLFNIFVLPEYQGKGIGGMIVRTLEQDEYFLRANRIEVPASITAEHFYLKFGYQHKNGIRSIDDEQHIPMEKFN